MAADAGWEIRGDREDEQLALERLRDDFQRTGEMLDSASVQRERGHTSLGELLRIFRDAGDPPGSFQVPDSVALGVYATNNWDPPLGSVSSLLNSGQIQLIRNPDLRSQLTQWPDVVRTFENMEMQERRNYEQYQLEYMYRFVPFVALVARTEPEVYAQPSRLEADYEGMLNFLPLENALEYRFYKNMELMDRLGVIEARLDTITGLLERELEN